MTKKNLSFFAAILCATLAFAQPITIQRCITDELMQYQERQLPGYLQRVNACFDNAKQIALQNQSNRSANDTVYHVQVVFHVVYTAPAENIPDSVIYSQIEVLNEDYRRRNADTSRTRDVFKPVAGDAGIEFHLATVDPDGNPTNGITRTAGTPGFLGFDPFTDNVKSSTTGGKSPWPTDKYLNVWVCNVLMGFGVLGYAFPPSNAPNWPPNSSTDSAKQGVVLHYPVVGRNYVNPIDPTVTKGRSLVHELGHYFGLRHIWGDGNCSEDDGIDDTPNAAAASQQTCDTTANTCVDSPVDYPDMIENYMDYSDDRCQNMFTQQQIGIIRAMLQTSRAGIATVEVVSGAKNMNDDFGSVSLFPNPASGIIELEVKMKEAKNYNYEILNVIGEKVVSASEKPASVSRSKIDLSQQPQGIYFAKISSGSATQVKKFSIVR